MGEDVESLPIKRTDNPEEVKKYIKSGMPEQEARNAVYKDLRIERLVRDQGKAKEIALLDGLTRLPNYRALMGDKNEKPPLIGELERLFEHTVRKGSGMDETLCVLMLDLDRFKDYNDRFGHLAGDDALRALATILVGNTRKADFVARYGGEEFTVVLPNTRVKDALKSAQRIRKAIEESTKFKDKTTVSIGLAYFPDLYTNPKNHMELIDIADKRLYSAKTGGRNRVVFSDNPPPKLL